MNWDGTIDELVIAAMYDEPRSLASLLRRLPNVYPGDVIASLGRLRAQNLRIPTFETEERPVSSELHLPTPHPLDYEWRYTPATREFISQTISRIARGSTVVLLGTPSIFLTHRGGEEVHLLDANERLREYLPSSNNFQCVDILADELPPLHAELVLADPPWYPEHLTAFLIAGAHLLRDGGTFLLSLPGTGTRPTIGEELAALYATAGSAGLQHEETVAGTLQYDIPPFEQNALRAAGIVLDVPWRAGDLARFTKVQPCQIARTLQPRTAWPEYRFGSVRIRAQRATFTEFGDPRLISLVENDILPTVSRRDERRERATVWTSGNRIFETSGLAALHEILQALQSGKDPLENQHGRTREEQSLIEAAVAQLHDLIAREASENEKNTA